MGIVPGVSAPQIGKISCLVTLFTFPFLFFPFLSFPFFPFLFFLSSPTVKTAGRFLSINTSNDAFFQPRMYRLGVRKFKFNI